MKKDEELVKKDEELAKKDEQLAEQLAKTKRVEEELERIRRQSAPLAGPSSNRDSTTRIAS